MKRGGLISTTINTKKAIFARTYLTRLDICFAKSNCYKIIYLKRSKIDIEYTEVQVIFIATNNQMCNDIVT